MDRLGQILGLERLWICMIWQPSSFNGFSMQSDRGIFIMLNYLP